MISPFLAVLITYVAAHVLKVLFAWYRTGAFTLRVVVLPGGMPSAHTALVASIATAVYAMTGLSATFLVALGFAVVVMYDAMTLRREVSAQKAVLDLLNRKVLGGKLKTVLAKEHIGHTPIEIVAGALVGVLITLAVLYA